MHSTTSQFLDAIRATGLQPPDVIVPGKFHRLPGIGKPKTNKAGWCKLFNDCMGGCFGDFSSDLNESWQAKPDRKFTNDEHVAFTRQVEEARAQADEDRNEKYAKAAEKAKSIWEASSRESEDHLYLAKKGISASGARIHEGSLVVPLFANGELKSLQFINADGSKRFLGGGQVSGCYFCIGKPETAKAICISEGFATGASIHQASGFAVVVAFNAGNLKSVATAIQKQYPSLPMIICADDDASNEANPGLTKAKDAANATGAKLVLPTFGDQRPEGATDFNDMAKLLGMDAVADTIKAAKSIDDGWPTPQSLTAKIDPEPYPIDALPKSLRAAVEEVHAFTKAPLPMVASSALAALSLATQAYADVKRAEKLSGPVSLFMLTIADSGERKSTCDGFFTGAIRDYEAKQAEAAKLPISNYKADLESWEAKHGGIKDNIRQLTKAGKPTADQESALRDLEHDKPEPPRVPRLIYGDATPEALKYSLAKSWPSGGVVSSEGGLVFGAHGMGKDSVMRNLATLNQLWDGVDIATERRSSESFTVRGARLTMALQVQEPTLRSFFARSDGLARGTGFLARFLVSWPISTQGQRSFSEPPDNWPALEKFNRRIEAILEQDVPIDNDGALSPPIFPLAVDTKLAWVIFHDAIESELRSGGELYDVRDVASKTADNAVRIATLFHVFEHGACGTIGLKAFEGASRIAAWHLHEARRFYGELALPEEIVSAVQLEEWLLDYCKKEGTNVISRRDIQRNITPGYLRKKAALEKALTELVELGRVRVIQEGQRKDIHVNPALLESLPQ